MNIIHMASAAIRKLWAFLLFTLAAAMAWIAYLWRDGPLPPQETAAEIVETIEVLGPFAILLDVLIIVGLLYGIKRGMESHIKEE